MFKKEAPLMEEKDLEKMTATELREFALKNFPGITGVHAMKKEDLLLAIHKTRGEDIKEVKKKKKAVKVPVDKKDLKKKIRLLKAEREKLLQKKNKKALTTIRKKIKRLKRLTQKAS
jgi:protein-arginine kinase activator protein McsA